MALTAREIAQIERVHSDGLSSRQIIRLMAQNGEKLTESTLRKYVQLGLLPRSRRVGQKGKHRGSRGIYPVEVIRQVDEIRRAMNDGETLEGLASAAQALRARLSDVRVTIDDALKAAEMDVQSGGLARSARTTLKARCAQLRQDAKAWLKNMETLANDLRSQRSEAEESVAPSSKRVPQGPRTRKRTAPTR